MDENSYEEYKRNFSRDQKKTQYFRQGRILLFLSVFFLIYLLWLLPFRAGNVGEIRGDEVKAGKNYYPQKVYYIEDLEILRANANTDNDELYCIAKFYDCDQNEWIILFTPGNDERLAERIELSSRFGTELNLTVSGYFQLQYFEDLSFAADSFYSVYGRKYADPEGGNMLEVNAKYLCDKSGNYTLEILFHPGVPLVSLVAGVFSLLFGLVWFFKNRPRRNA